MEMLHALLSVITSVWFGEIGQKVTRGKYVDLLAQEGGRWIGLSRIIVYLRFDRFRMVSFQYAPPQQQE